LRKLLLFLIFPILTVAAVGAYCYKALFSKREVNGQVEVKKGESLRELLRRLAELNLIEEPTLAYYYLRIERIPVKSGCYRFSGELSTVEVLKELSKGKPCLKSFTIVPGSTLLDVDRVLAEKGFCRKGEVLELSRDRALLEELKVPTLEGFLFPDTYLVNKESSCREALKVPVKRFFTELSSVMKDYTPPPKVKKALDKPTLLKVVTVASIVEKETSKEEERPLVAAVIYNRLIKKMKLQCDPTVIYALRLKGVEKERLLFKDLEVDSPYNTYRYKGLPPSPICNPSLSSIRAALYPAQVNYLYFVANGKGGHTFSESYNQHLKEVRKFRKWQRGS
jgi:UPF0755 protein